MRKKKIVSRERGARFQESEKPVSNVRILAEAWSVQVRCTQEVHYARSAQDPVAHTQPLGARIVYLGLNEVRTGPLGNT